MFSVSCMTARPCRWRSTSRGEGNVDAEEVSVADLEAWVAAEVKPKAESLRQVGEGAVGNLRRHACRERCPSSRQ